MFLGKGVLEICSKFTGEHPCRSAISIKLQSNFTEIILRHMFSCKFATYFRTTFFRNTSGRLLLNEVLNWNYFYRSYQCHSNVRFTNTNIKKQTFFSMRILFSNKWTCSITQEDENKQIVK